MEEVPKIVYFHRAESAWIADGLKHPYVIKSVSCVNGNIVAPVGESFTGMVSYHGSAMHRAGWVDAADYLEDLHAI